MTEYTTGGKTSSGGPSALLVAAAGAIAGAALVAIGVSLGIVAAGDEAPIRVKNGSIDAELAYSGRYWREDGNRQNWKINRGTRGSEDIEVFIAPTNQSSCPGGLLLTGRTVRFEHSDGGYLRVTAPNRKTKLNASKDLVRSQDERTVSYQAPGGYIRVIEVDGKAVCTFESRDDGLAVLLLDR